MFEKNIHTDKALKNNGFSAVRLPLQDNRFNLNSRTLSSLVSFRLFVKRTYG